jgi:SpoVK/Ycf46/Vps4 family AAA+-type ATPase
MAKAKAAQVEKPAQQTRKITIRSHLGRFIDSRHGIVAVSTDDEHRFLKVEIQAMLNGSVERIFRWDASTKIVERKTGQDGAFANMRSLLAWFAKPVSPDANVSPPTSPIAGGEINESNPAPPGSVLIVLDAMYYLQATTADKKHSNPVLTRELKSYLPALVEQKKIVFLVGHGEPYIPPELRRIIPLFEYPMPDLNYMHSIVAKMTRSFATDAERKTNANAGLDLSFDETDEVAKKLLGMTESEAESVLKRAVLENIKKRRADPSLPMEFDHEILEQARVERNERNDGIKLVMPQKGGSEMRGISLVGGSHRLRDWFFNGVFRKFSPEAKDEHFDMPKGAVLFGPGGVGKDNIVEAIAQEVGWPIVYADLGAAMAPFQGESHRNFRQILTYAEDLAPCFLALSEFEKMFAGAMTPGSAACDGGTSQAILATWLNWMQSRKAPVFVWGLTNDLSGLSQPSLRAGRWDAVWFMDLPPRSDRKEIFEVHLKRTHWGIEGFDLDDLADRTAGHTGAEIRKIIDEAISIKFSEEGPKSLGHLLRQEHLVRAIDLVPSTLKLRGRDIEAMRKLAKEGGYPLANPEEKTVNSGKLLTEITNITQS